MNDECIAACTDPEYYTDYCTVTVVSIWSDLSQFNGLLDYAIYDWMDDTGRNATTVNNGR